MKTIVLPILGAVVCGPFLLVAGIIFVIGFALFALADLALDFFCACILPRR